MAALTLLFVLATLMVTGVFLALLLIPTPKFFLRIVISLLGKLNSPLLAWPVRVMGALLVLLTANATFEMYKYETRPEPEDAHRKDFTLARFRAERNFYLHMFTFALVLITWRVQRVVSNQKKLESDVETLRGDNEKLKRH